MQAGRAVFQTVCRSATRRGSCGHQNASGSEPQGTACHASEAEPQEMVVVAEDLRAVQLAIDAALPIHRLCSPFLMCPSAARSFCPSCIPVDDKMGRHNRPFLSRRGALCLFVGAERAFPQLFSRGFWTEHLESRVCFSQSIWNDYSS